MAGTRAGAAAPRGCRSSASGRRHASLEQLRRELGLAEPVDLATVAASCDWSAIGPATDAARAGRRCSRCSPRRWRRCSERGPRKAQAWPPSCGARAGGWTRSWPSCGTRPATCPPGPSAPAGAAGRRRLRAGQRRPGRRPPGPGGGAAGRRLDVTEELARLEATDCGCTSCWWGRAGREGVGRTLDFVLQELGRELNTIGSKAQDAEVSALVIDGKGRAGEDPRAGAEYRVMSGYFRRGILLVISSPSGAGKTTLARRLAAATSCTSRSRTPRARRGPARSTASTTTSSATTSSARWSSPGVRRVGGGARQPLRHRHPHGQPRHRAGQRLPVRHRLPGRPADPPAVAQRQRAGVHPAAVAGGAGAPAAQPRHRRARGDRAPAGDRPEGAGPLRRIRLPGGERRPRDGLRRAVVHLRRRPLRPIARRRPRPGAAGRGRARWSGSRNRPGSGRIEY